MKNKNTKMPAGDYWIGDLCYVIDDDCGYWDEVCKALFKVDEDGNYVSNRGGVYELSNGIQYAIYGTAWGDGGYEDQNGKVYGVDAGVIGCINVLDIKKLGSSIASGGHVHHFENEFDTGYDDGTIFFGSLKIETDPSYDEDDNDDCPKCGNKTYELACHCDGWDAEGND